MTRRTLVLLAAAVLLFAACNPEREMNAFSTGEDVRLVVGNAEQFVYDPAFCQMAYNRDKGQFRAHTDNTSDFFIANMSATPVSLGQSITADITWTTSDDIVSRKNLTLEVIRLEGDKVWLWSKSGHIGLTIRILD